jgi:DNA-directed RNA polymerase specialized sigma24 family protein
MRVEPPLGALDVTVSAEAPEPSDDLRPALAHLPLQLAAVIRLRYRLGEPAGPPRTSKEVALRLGLTLAQVRADEARAMAHLRGRLAKVSSRAPRSIG